MDTFFDHVLATARQKGASDVHLKAGLSPVFRIKGQLVSAWDPRQRDTPPLTRDFLHGIAMSLLTDRRREVLERTGDVTLVMASPAGTRHRVHISQQRGGIGISLRVIPPTIPLFDRLGVPAETRELLAPGPGLLLVAAGPGHGKTTTLAAMVDDLVRRHPIRVVTIEDPVEILLEDHQGVVVQREVGFDVPSMAAGLRANARLDADAVMVGDLPDREAVGLAVSAAENGSLVLAGITAPSAEAAITRLTGLWDGGARPAIRGRLSAVLRGVLHQRLVPAKRAGLTAEATLLRAEKAAATVVEERGESD